MEYYNAVYIKKAELLIFLRNDLEILETRIVIARN